jgi:O-antigen ligase
MGFRPIGSSGDPNTFAINLAGAALIAITLLACRPSWQRALVAAVVFPGIVFVILATASRGAMLALTGGCAVFLAFSAIRGKLLIAATGAIVAVGTFVGFTANVSPLASARLVGEVGTESVGYRVGWTQMALEMWRDHPIVGIGPSQFLRYYATYRVDSVPREEYYPHNTFIQVLAENGVVGLLVFLGLWAYAFNRAVVAYRGARTPVERNLAAGLGGMLTAFALFALTSNTLEIEIYWVTFAFLALLARMVQEPRIPERVS